jgi:ABC-2 type transport system ATP-binding protein
MAGKHIDQHKTPNTASALSVSGLSKSFNDVFAVNNLNLELIPGEFYAFLGVNGAGKTTTMRMIAGLLAADSGSIKVFGHDIASEPLKAKSIMAWLPDEPLLYDKLTPFEYLEFVAGLWGVDPILAAKHGEELLRWFDLWAVKDKRCEGFSRGMKQKTAIAGALLHDPKLLLMDEPFSGLDASVARGLKDLLVDKAKSGATIILTTHIMEIAERLAQRIGIIHNGKLLAEGDMSQLRSQTNSDGANLEEIFLKLADEQNAS